MMTKEEILIEARSSFELEGMVITKEDEERALRCLSGETTFEEEKKSIIEKYVRVKS